MSSDILIVDDEADIRELVAGILDDEGYRTRTARSSDDALAQIEQRRPHLIFLDIWLQGAGSMACNCSRASRSCTRKSRS